jgi:hypothetical protein
MLFYAKNKKTEIFDKTKKRSNFAESDKGRYWKIKKMERTKIFISSVQSVIRKLKHTVNKVLSLRDRQSHRDYNSNASVQVELYNNRLEISNPGQLPYGLTLEMLRGKHNSRPANPLIAHPLYLYGSIEQVQNKPNITAVELAKSIGINARNIQKNIEKLKSRGIIERIGADKGEH